MNSLLILIGILIGISSIYIIVKKNDKINESNIYILSFISIVTQLYILFIDKITTNYTGVICSAVSILVVYIILCYILKNDNYINQTYLTIILTFMFIVFCGVLTYATL